MIAYNILSITISILSLLFAILSACFCLVIYNDLKEKIDVLNGSKKAYEKYKNIDGLYTTKNEKGR